MLESELYDDLMGRSCADNRKRPGKADLAVPAALQQVWSPLLIHLTGLRPSLPSLLAENIVSILVDTEFPNTPDYTPAEGKKEKEKERQSYRWTLAVWLIYLWSASSSEGTPYLAEEDSKALWSRIANSLLEGDAV